MILRVLLSHQWKSFLRGRNTGGTVLMQVFTGLFVLYMLSAAGSLGFLLQRILLRRFPGQDPVGVFCGLILYYFLFESFARFLFQVLPTLSVQAYLLQNIRKRSLLTFLHIRSLFTVFSLLPWLLLAPFILGTIAARLGALTAWGFLLGLLSLNLAVHFLLLVIKRKSLLQPAWLIGIFAFVALVIGGDLIGRLPLRVFSRSIFEPMLHTGWTIIVCIALALISMANSFRFFRRRLYVPEGINQALISPGASLGWLRHFGLQGELLAMECRMIFRNRRPRTLFILSIGFMLYGFLVYRPSLTAEHPFGMMVFGSAFITGLFLVNYGQFFWAGQCNHFDGLLTARVPIREYIRSRFLLMQGLATIALLLSLGYGFLNWQAVPLLVSAFLFNAGVHTVLIGIVSAFKYQRIDIDKNAAFNQQGVGAAQWIYTASVLAIAMVIYWPAAHLINQWAGVMALGVAGLISLLFQERWIDFIEKLFKQNKYKILAGFRES